ncbi:MAG TPA: hypothetical protein VFQ13_24690 [Anaerolineales bacterium]|nr:hypothetical protein [Anaerolineales bacterium]
MVTIVEQLVGSSTYSRNLTQYSIDKQITAFIFWNTQVIQQSGFARVWLKLNVDLRDMMSPAKSCQ